MHTLVDKTHLSNSIINRGRGFSNFSLLKTLINNNIDYCVQLKTSEILFAQQVFADPRIDFMTDWLPSDAELATSKNKKVDISPIKLRVTKITLSGGEIEVLITSLLDTDKFPLEDISNLYRLRWGIEEGFKNLKPKMKLEEFGCIRQEGVYQEFLLDFLISGKFYFIIR